MPKLTQSFDEVQAGMNISVDNVQADVAGYDDLQGNVGSSRRLAANPPAERAYDYGIASGVDFLTDGFAVGEGTQITQQTTHSAKLLSEIDEHIHYTTPTDPTGTRMRWQLDIIMACVGQPYSLVAGSPFTAEHIFTDDESGIHGIFDIADIPPLNAGVSCVYKAILTRIAATQDEYGGEIYVDFIDGHIKIDQSRGSRQEVVK
jgi:hypothetical protein